MELKTNQVASQKEHFVRKINIIEVCRLEHDQQMETANLHEERGQKLLKMLN